MKNNRLFYNIKNLASLSIPKVFFKVQKDKIIQKIFERNDLKEIISRVNYYCKLQDSIIPFHLVPSEKIQFLNQHKLRTKNTNYFFDSYEFLKYFPQNLKWIFEKGDINYYLQYPSITKSRPINGDNQNSVLLNLDKIRHFNFISDPFSYEDKKDLLIFRGASYQEHRKKFLEKYFNHPLCNLGDTQKGESKYKKEKISIKEHLKYKFILSLEGNDVATNLKWIMSSNSIAIMPKPKFETFFMEGILKEDFHYIKIKEDYSDLETKLLYYIHHPKEAKEIIKNANEYTQKFQNKEKEKIISILTLEKYFYKTNQIDIDKRLEKLLTNL